ncbi:VOC family protein [Aliihoeflea aestuarii]|uniref:VOC family protein n=1 Tax=Aliihoeflea aestuarii TaxID=453840 RepID=UPI002093E622|nr:VOC family protein [Aliihoeflea aestuarii]MCO6390677.1 VOC family protein [Aliihoeflea aestuarii]
MSPRALDHCVLPVADLAAARERYAALGFTVAPQGTHPFGTTNACIYFADDTFLEPLAIGDAGQVSEAVRAGNVFVGRDALYRRTVGENGFSALVFKTDDAKADDAAFLSAGISAGLLLDFSRPFVDPAGKSGTVSFRLAFAAHPQSDACYFFTCERINAPSSAGRAVLEQHANGVRGIVGVRLCAAEPAAYEDFLVSLTGASVTRTDEGLCASLPTGTVEIVAMDCALRLDAIRFSASDLGSTADLFETGGVAFERTDRQLTVWPTSGQGATFIFEENA